MRRILAVAEEYCDTSKLLDEFQPSCVSSRFRLPMLSNEGSKVRVELLNMGMRP